MKLAGMSNTNIVSELKKDFTNEELDKVANKIDVLVNQSETLDELKHKISQYLFR